MISCVFFFQAEDGIRDFCLSRGLGDVYKRQLYQLLGGSNKPVKAYAGGISLGYQAPNLLAEEAGKLVSQGYRAVKLRVGDTASRDIERVRAVRLALGADIDILVDANTGYTLEDVRKVMPVF